MLLFVGLGNPTPNSENNRHNIGFKLIDALNKKIQAIIISCTRLRFLSPMAITGTKEPFLTPFLLVSLALS